MKGIVDDDEEEDALLDLRSFLMMYTQGPTPPPSSSESFSTTSKSASEMFPSIDQRYLLKLVLCKLSTKTSSSQLIPSSVTAFRCETTTTTPFTLQTRAISEKQALAVFVPILLLDEIRASSVPLSIAPSEARLCAFLMKQEQNEPSEPNEKKE